VRKLAVILAFTLLLGCSPKMIVMNNGIPAPDNAVTLKNDSSGLMATFNFRKVVEESEESLSSEYLDFNKKIYIDEDTKAVVLDLWVFNPKKIKYQVNKIIEIKGHTLSRSEKIVYEGKDVSKRFQLTGPVIPGQEVRLGAFVRIGKLPMFFAGDAWYKIRKEVEFNYRENTR